MMTLIATGILVSYLYSAAVTFGLRGEHFYDAAAMLTSFSLLGHWMEMRSRVATGRTVEVLLQLAPPMARRVRDGREEEVPLDAVAVSFWAAIYNVVAIPLAAGALYPSLSILPKPAWAALAMSASTVTVTVNALLLPRLERTRA